MDRLDRMRGCLLLSAAGDALGYAVEFDRLKEIQKTYGPDGIQSYELSPFDHKAIFSDDTQMTLFTAEGLLFASARKDRSEKEYIWLAYMDWLTTQFDDAPEPFQKCRILDEKRLHHRRAPGNTCLGALKGGVMGTMEEPINHSKGCGGIMRIAPCALVHRDRREAAVSAAEASALTHTHPMGYIPSATMAFILHSIVWEEETDMKQIVLDAMQDTEKLFPGNAYMPEYVDLMNRAVACADNSKSDMENIRELGEGWVADEAMAIAAYCAMRHPTDASAVLRAAVNHDGDSDSTGAVAGAIVGAMIGKEAIPAEWTKHLECRALIEAMADDLFKAAQDPASLPKMYRSEVIQ